MEIEAIKIDVSASVKGENKIDRLAQKLEALGNALKGIPQDVVDKLERLGSAANFQMGKGPTQLASAIKKICDQSDKLGSVVDEMGRLASYDFSNLADASEGIKAAARSANRTSSAGSAESMTPMTSGTTYREAQEATEAYNDEADAADNASGAVREHADESVRAARKIEKHTSALGKAVKAFGRILAYRAIRNVIKTIGQAFAEGRNNLYQYSLALNNLDSAKASGNLNDLATAALYAKNSVGAMMGPIIQSTVPLIQQLVDWLAIGTNAINQFISALQGKTTYTRAKKYADDYADSVKGIGKAAKEALSYLLPFDELNVLPDNSDRGRGSTTTTPDYSEMFEEVEINEKLLNFINEKLIPSIEWIKQHMDEILTVAGAIGTAILKWKISSKLTSLLPNIGGEIKDKLKFLQKPLEFTVGLAIAIAGITISWNAGKALGSKGWDKMTLWEKISTFLGPAVTALGGALVGHAIAGLPGAAIGAVIGFGVGLVFEGIAFARERKQQDGPDWLIHDIEKLRTSFDEKWATFRQSVVEKYGELAQWLEDNKIPLATTVRIAGESAGSQLDNIGYRVDLFLVRIRTAVAAIRRISEGDWKGAWQTIKDGAKEEIDLAEKRFEDFRDTVSNIVNELKDHLGKRWEETKSDFETAWNGISKFATEKVPEIIDDIENFFEELPGKISYWLGFALGAIGAWVTDSINWVTENVPTIISKVVTFFEELPGKIGTAIASFADTLATWASDAIGWVNENVPKILNSIVDWFEGLPDALVNVGKNLIYGLWNGVLSVGSWLYDKVGSYFGKLWDIITDSVGSFGRGVRAGYETVPRFASGGYVSDGELFMAREAGPEMVGRIGNRNAVANNDQIVAGIASGVEEANEPVVNAVLAIGAQIVGAIRESGGNGITVDDIARGVTRWQARQARAVGV